MRHVVAIVTGVLLLGGCAAGSAQVRGATDDAVMAAPGPDLVGTWQGMAWSVPGSLYLINAPVELTIKPDGTWTRSRRGDPQASGRVRVAGDRVFLDEQKSKDVEQRIELRRTGDQLWGMSEAFVPGAMNAVQLERAS
jgi:hypothetical protein